eukprot:CAMPEP_0113586572 /NCGR_PEP_ID=MMETSP0015_2-20120614/34371_1 /TAXON_ID=2838 /ORGANISM="Odontella" /LENGTH=763 /DNA_ID=CAMNT_0000492023 /DNA_START=259 /DNA_END=2550 /DNA_ORIENTATION=- /assembly_acc=CAM_ASM_000160
MTSGNCVGDRSESCIVSIKSRNLAGLDHGEGSVAVDLGSCPSLVAVTGETGTGKSLLVHKALEVAMGGKVSQSIVPSLDTTVGNESNATVEVELKLSQPHLDITRIIMAHHGIDPTLLENGRRSSQKNDTLPRLFLKRTISLQMKPHMQGEGLEKGERIKSPKPRLKSRCEVNGQVVTLKALRAIASPLVTLVDASAAASALSKPTSRLAIIDKGVSTRTKAAAWEAREKYRQARQVREALEMKAESKVLPASLPGYGDETTKEALDLLTHWVDELDEFERRIQGLQDVCMTATTYTCTVKSLLKSSWTEESYSNLLDLRGHIKALDAQIIAAESAVEALSSLSSSDSVVSALERARAFLFDATKSETDSRSDGDLQPVLDSAENAHELLNDVESALSSCVCCIEDRNRGLLAKLQQERGSLRLSIEDIDAIIADWNSLARKHSVSPFDLPLCHQSMRAELTDGDNYREEISKAKASEEVALQHFQHACDELTAARGEVAEMLSGSVMRYLPSLGMERSFFCAQLNGSVLKCTSASAFGIGSELGVDSVDFFLRHQLDAPAKCQSDEQVSPKSRGGRLEDIGSSGEKARILLAVESILSGSVKAACGGAVATEIGSSDAAQVVLEDAIRNCPPIAMIYDEIDAHCGGRASVAVAKLLASQARSDTPIVQSTQRSGQIVSITHSPSVAAIADRHIMIQIEPAQLAKENRQTVTVSTINGAARRKELARMAAGDLAPEEAEKLADALLRVGMLERNGNNGDNTSF